MGWRRKPPPFGDESVSRQTGSLLGPLADALEFFVDRFFWGHFQEKARSGRDPLESGFDERKIADGAGRRRIVSLRSQRLDTPSMLGRTASSESAAAISPSNMYS